MSMFNCSCRCRCTTAAAVLAVVFGVLAAFLQITGVISVTTVFAWVAFGIAVVYLGVLALTGRNGQSECACPALNALLAGALGTILLALVLLAVGITATSVISAILVGLLVFFFVLMLAATVCFIRYNGDCTGS